MKKLNKSGIAKVIDYISESNVEYLSVNGCDMLFGIVNNNDIDKLNRLGIKLESVGVDGKGVNKCHNVYHDVVNEESEIDVINPEDVIHKEEDIEELIEKLGDRFVTKDQLEQLMSGFAEKLNEK